MNAAQHQKQIDDAGDIENAIEKIRKQCRDLLLDFDDVSVDYCERGQIKWYDIPGHVVFDEMMGLDALEYEDAMRNLKKEPVKSAQRLQALLEKAVDHLVALMPLEEAAELEIERVNSARTMWVNKAKGKVA